MKTLLFKVLAKMFYVAIILVTINWAVFAYIFARNYLFFIGKTLNFFKKL